MPRWQLAIVLCVGAALTGGCSRQSVKSDGSSTVFPITEAVAEEFRKEQPRVRVIIGRSGTGGGFKKFSHGEIDICNASRPITEEETRACDANNIEFLPFQIALDGLAVCVNPENDWCDCLTVEQLKTIWQPESAVSKWSDLDAKWPDEKIRLYGPGTDSGTFDFFTEVIVGQPKKSRGDYTQSEDDNTLVTGVAGDKYSLGYFGLAYYEENDKKLKLLGIDPGDGSCVKPNTQTVRDNTYKPLSRPLFIYVRTSSLERPEVRSFVTFYIDRASELVPQARYVPVPEEIVQKDRDALDEKLKSIKPAA